jgi:hypothetical protein
MFSLARPESVPVLPDAVDVVWAATVGKTPGDRDAEHIPARNASRRIAHRGYRRSGRRTSKAGREGTATVRGAGRGPTHRSPALAVQTGDTAPTLAVITPAFPPST